MAGNVPAPPVGSGTPVGPYAPQTGYPNPGGAPSPQFFALLSAMLQTLNAIATTLASITPSLRQESALGGITAAAGGGQAAATQLSAQFNEIDVVATAADSVALPVSAAGSLIGIANNGAHSLQVFGAAPDTINGSPTATGVALPAGHAALYFCAAPGAWWSVPTAP